MIEQSRPAQKAPALELIGRIVRAFDEAGIVYCHWKSNEAIDRSASGANDLDLLIAARHAARFEAILRQHGFVKAERPRGQRMPGIFDRYGLDDATGTIVHVHGHTRLTVGDDMTKNFSLPIETEYLASVTRDGLFPLPAPEYEYLLLVLRLGIKHLPLDAIALGKGRCTKSELRELAWLEERIDPTQVEELVDRHFPSVGAELFSDVRRAVNSDTSVGRRALVGRRLLTALSPFARRSPSVDVVLRIWRRIGVRLRGVLRRPKPRKRLATGKVIAVIGSDGAGKSTAVERLRELFDDFDVAHVHMGKPSKSIVTRVVKTPIRQLRRFGLFASTRMPAWTDPGTENLGTVFAIWHTLTARDRARAAKRAHRLAAQGVIVITDRWPMDRLRLMDAPRLDNDALRRRGWLMDRLADREATYYQRVGLPDVGIVLLVDADTAVARRRDEPEDFVRRRAEDFASIDWTGSNVTIVDATQTLDATFGQIRRIAWESLTEATR